MNILFIGGTKFIGRKLVTQFLQNGHNVTIFSRSPNADSRVTTISGDREVAADLQRLAINIKDVQFDVVYDMCAYSLDHARTLYPIIKDHTERLVLFSTAAVYPKSDIFPLAENHMLGSHTSFGDYGTKKAEVEDYYVKKTVADSIGLTIFRPHYILGVGDYFQRHHYLFSRLENGDPLYVPGNGQALIQLAWSEDVVRLFHTVPFLQSIQTEVVNIAGDELISLDGLVREFAAILGVAPDIRHVRYEDHGLDERRFYDDYFIFPNLDLVLDNSKAKQTYGYRPFRTADMVPLLLHDWRRTKDQYIRINNAEDLFA